MHVSVHAHILLVRVQIRKCKHSCGCMQAELHLFNSVFYREQKLSLIQGRWWSPVGCSHSCPRGGRLQGSPGCWMHSIRSLAHNASMFFSCFPSYRLKEDWSYKTRYIKICHMWQRLKVWSVVMLITSGANNIWECHRRLSIPQADTLGLTSSSKISKKN